MKLQREKQELDMIMSKNKLRQSASTTSISSVGSVPKIISTSEQPPPKSILKKRPLSTVAEGSGRRNDVATDAKEGASNGPSNKKVKVAESDEAAKEPTPKRTISWSKALDHPKGDVVPFAADTFPKVDNGKQNISWKNLFEYEPSEPPKVTVSTALDNNSPIHRKPEANNELKKATEKESPTPKGSGDKAKRKTDDEAWQAFQAEMDKVDKETATSSPSTTEAKVSTKSVGASESSGQAVTTKEEETPEDGTEDAAQASYEARIAKFRLKAIARRKAKSGKLNMDGGAMYTPELAEPMEDAASKPHPLNNLLSPEEIIRQQKEKAQRLAENY